MLGWSHPPNLCVTAQQRLFWWLVWQHYENAFNMKPQEYRGSFFLSTKMLLITLELLKGIFRCKFNPWFDTPWHQVGPPVEREICRPLAYEVLTSSETTAQQQYTAVNGYSIVYTQSLSLHFFLFFFFLLKRMLSLYRSIISQCCSFILEAFYYEVG